MDYRLTLDERCRIATELREFILKKENPRRLESINDPELKPHEIAEKAFAFEYFLDRYRPRLNVKFKKGIVYDLGWSHATIELNEETCCQERIVRMATEKTMLWAVEKGILDWTTERLLLSEYDGSNITQMNLNLFLFEVYYELVREFCREKIEQEWKRKRRKRRKKKP